MRIWQDSNENFYPPINTYYHLTSLEKGLTLLKDLRVIHQARKKREKIKTIFKVFEIEYSILKKMTKWEN